MTTEIFKTELGNEVTVRFMCGDWRIVLWNQSQVRVGKTAFDTKEAALATLRTNSIVVRR